MINAKQERDKPLRQFAARLCGLAAVCDLTVTCACTKKVSAVDKWVRLSLIGAVCELVPQLDLVRLVRGSYILVPTFPEELEVFLAASSTDLWSGYL